MTNDLHVRKDGVVGWITLNRPKALNALTYEMCLEIEKALDEWSEDASVSMLIIDAVGEKAFCAGGDIAEMYATGMAGDFSYGRQFWRDEYRMNAKLFRFPKPVASFLQGFTMGGGVGVGCHASHRIVCESSQISMPEVGIGLVPDVGGSFILANAPGRLGEYLGTTASRLGPGDAILAGFADYYLPENTWNEVKLELVKTGDWTRIDAMADPAPNAAFTNMRVEIDQHFGGETLADIRRSLMAEETDFTKETLKKLGRNSPLSMACAIEMIHRLRGSESIERALELEYRFTHRAMEHGDFLEGIRAAIIDKDRTPKWRHDLGEPLDVDMSKMLRPLGRDALTL